MNKPLAEVKQFTAATVFVPRALADAVGNYVTDNIAAGVELDESENNNMVGIKFYVPESNQNDFRPALRKYLAQIVSIEMPDPPRIYESTVASQDWEEAYKKSMRPILIGSDIGVRPPWAKTPSEVAYDIIIEPKMAFGTGHHETTRACLQLIYKHFQRGEQFLDFGCGSGVLAVLAHKLGASFIKAIDNDITAVQNCRENFEINGVYLSNEVLMGSFDQIINDAPYGMVCANLNKSDLLDNFDLLKKLAGENGFLILSGILETEQSEIERPIRDSKMTMVDFIHENEWLTYGLRK